ncbi:Glycosyltransferase [Quillaja saponaria]|uniref:Glycosyltransferase n=1 Tax=Quillaja saponaria TaxID=32244 RepID=A0AAD7Q7V2_QUISA|nr:Glycosyltransferase [Quillaja saponaria]
MDAQPNPLHFVIFPHLATGHLIPMVDIARLLAQRSAIITIFTTEQNAARFENVLARAVSSGLSIHLVLVPVAFEEAGLPQGYDNFDMLPSFDMQFKLFTAIKLMQNPAEKLFAALKLKPDCIISDVCVPWTIEIARKNRIPRISFHGISSFCQLTSYNLGISKVPKNPTSEPSVQLVMPEIPDQVEIITEVQTQAQLDQKLMHYSIQMMVADVNSYGVIVNSFEELEEAYVKDYKKVRKVWCIGPVSLCNKSESDKAERGKKASIDEHQCLEWLNLQQENSVVYACLGSQSNLLPSKLIELALGLEASNRPFIWVIRGGKSTLEELEKWITRNGFEEKIKGRGLLIRGWAPQVLILSHPSIGGFLTHCGWNSILEGISAGVPLITWPVFADQFFNAKHVTQVLKIGVRIWEDEPGYGQEEKIVVKKEDIKSAIEKVIDEGEESEARRKRVRQLGDMANHSVEEGGSSHVNLSLFIQDIMQQPK